MQSAAPTMAVPSLVRLGESRRWRLFFNVIAAIYLTLLIAPWRFLMPGLGLDWSAHVATAHALVSGWQWGHDVIYGFGPLGPLYFRFFLEGTLLVTAVFWILVAVAFAAILLELLKPVPLPWACVLFFCFALALTYRRADTVFFVIPMLAAIGAFRSPEPVRTWKILLLALLGGFGALAKLTFGLLSFLIFLVLDADRARRKAPPMYLPAFLAAFVGGYLIAGQELQYFFPFVFRSGSFVSGYTEAMQLWGPHTEVALFLIATAIVAVFFWRHEFRRNEAAHSFLRGALFAMCTGFFLFMVFKQGFVRHDLHTITSWDSLGAGAAAYIASVWQRIDSRKALVFATGAVVFASGYSIRVQADYGHLNLWSKLVAGPVQQLASAGIFVVDRDAWWRHQQQRRSATLATIREAIPLPSLDGPVDSIPPIQSAVIAHGLDYRPRPALQETSAYAGNLIEANLEFIRSDRAPRYIIHSTGSIDGRYPSLADGPMWPELLRLYEPDRLEGRNLILRRRAAALKSILSEPMQAVARVGQGIAVPVSGPVFAKLRTRKTLFGHVAQLLFKPGAMWLTVKLSDDSVQRFRIIPEVVRHGFVLSPLIDDNEKLAALSTGYPELYPQSKVVAFQVDLDALAKFVYEPTIEVEVRPLQTEALRAQSPDTEIQALFRSAFEKRK
jgi:hypothetical protein